MTATYRVNFTKLGRGELSAPTEATFEATDEADLTWQVMTFVRPKLVSKGVDVSVDLDTDGNGDGIVSAGFHQVGRFTVERVIPTQLELEDQ